MSALGAYTPGNEEALENYVDNLARIHTTARVASSVIQEEFLSTAKISQELAEEMMAFEDLDEMFDFLAKSQCPSSLYAQKLDLLTTQTARQDSVSAAVMAARELIVRHTRVNDRRGRPYLSGGFEPYCIEILSRHLHLEIFQETTKGIGPRSFYELESYALRLEENMKEAGSGAVYAVETEIRRPPTYPRGRGGYKKSFAIDVLKWDPHSEVEEVVEPIGVNPTSLRRRNSTDAFVVVALTLRQNALN